MSKYIVYLRTNTVNGKQYVGQTNNFNKREKHWNSLKQKYANSYLCFDREKYGIKNFTVEILAEVETREEAWKLEQKYIKELNTLYPSGYNMCGGGKTNTGWYVTDEARKNISEAHKGLKQSEEQIEKRTAKIRGRHHTDEAKKKISEARKGKKMPEEAVRKMAEKLRELHLIPTSAFKKGHEPWNKGKEMPKEMVKKMTKQLYQYTLDDKFVRLWNSVKDAKENGFHHADAVARGERKQDKGYKFSYEKMIGEAIAPPTIV